MAKRAGRCAMHEIALRQGSRETGYQGNDPANALAQGRGRYGIGNDVKVLIPSDAAGRKRPFAKTDEK